MSKRKYKYNNKYKKETSYTLMCGISILIRQYVLPNPFTNMFDSGMAELINLCCGGVLVPLAYFLTGTWYVSKKGEYWIGSLGFLVNYSILTGLILLISKFISDIYWCLGLLVMLYIALCVIESKLLNRRSNCF